MDIQTSLPPYGKIDQQTILCIADSSKRHHVPEMLIHALIMKEGGKRGECTPEIKSRSRSCGLGQIKENSWRAHFEKHGIPYEYIIYDNCTNVEATTYIMSKMFQIKREWVSAIAAYNTGPYATSIEAQRAGYLYATDIISLWWRFEEWSSALKKNQTPK